MNKTIYSIAILGFIFLLASATSSAQPELIESTNEQLIDIDGIFDTRLGEPQDFRIPTDPFYDYIRFTLRGADGGNAEGQFGTASGGNGATVNFDVEIGTGPDQLAPGTVIRCIVGKRGTTSSRTNHAGSGGGGGTGILLKDSNGDFEIALAVAGGGSGAAYNLGDTKNGQGGRASESGGDGVNSNVGAAASGGQNGERGETIDNNSQGGGGLFNGWIEADGGGAGVDAGGNGGDGNNIDADGGYGCGGGGAGGFDNISIAMGGGGGGYSGGGAGFADRGGGGGSFLHPDYTFNSIKADGGADNQANFGRITYRFYCSARFAGVTLLQDYFCYGQEIIQIQSNARSYCNQNGEVVFKCVETDEQNTDGVFGDSTLLTGGQTYHYELYYEGELVDTLSYTVSSSMVDEEQPSVLCGNLNITFDLNDDLNPTITKSEIMTGSSDNCGIASFEITGYGDSRTFSCDDLGSNTVSAVVTDYAGNSRSCTANVEIIGGYPDTLATLAEEKALDVSGQATLSMADVTFTLISSTVCFTAAEVRGNYSIPAAYQTLDCDEIGTQTITLDKTDTGFPDVTLELTVTDPISATASAAPITLILDSTGVAAFIKDSIDFSVSDNCYTEAEIIGAYSIPVAFSTFDCSQTGLNFVTLEKSIETLPDVTVQVTVEQSGGLTLPTITTGYCTDSPFNLTRLEDAITSASGTFTYTQQIERLYVPDFLGGIVNVVDLSINDTLTTIPVGSQPVGVAVSPDKQTIYITNQGSKSVSAIDVATNTVKATIPLGGDPFGIAFSPDSARAYVTYFRDDSLAIIDVAHDSVLHTVAVGDNPLGVAVSPDATKVFVANKNSANVSVVTAEGDSVTTITLGGSPRSVAFNATGSLAYVSIGSSVSIINTTTNTVQETVSISVSANYLLVSPSGDVYTAHSDDKINRIEPDNGNTVTVFSIDPVTTNYMTGLSINETGSILYAADFTGKKIILFDTQGDTVKRFIPLSGIGEAFGNFYVKADLLVTTPTAFLPDSGTVVQVTFDGGSGCAANTTIVFTGIQQEASIISHPSSDTKCPGEPVSFNIIAEGEDLSYQWKKDGVEINGETASTLSLNEVSIEDAAEYTCMVMSLCDTLFSNSATLIVPNATYILSHPESNITCQGLSVTFGVMAEGSSLTYQWKKDGMDIPGAIADTLEIIGVDAADAATYTCLVAGDCGSLTSNGATLTVGTPTSITAQPVSDIICPAGSVVFRVTAEGTNLSYQWQKDGLDISGGTTDTLELVGVNANDTGSYTCLVNGVCGSMTSEIATLGLLGALECVPCADGVVVDYPISEELVLRSSDTLTARDTIRATAVVTFTAEEALLFEPGFSIEAGGTLDAFIATCTFSSDLENVQSDIGSVNPQTNGKVFRQNLKRLQVEVTSDPIQEEITVKFFLPEPGDLSLSLIDMDGNLLYEHQYPKTSLGLQSTTFQPGNLPDGEYRLLVEANDDSIVKRLIISRK